VATLQYVRVFLAAKLISETINLIVLIPLAYQYLQQAIQALLEDTFESLEKTEVYFCRNLSHSHNINCITPIVTYRNVLASFIFNCRCKIQQQM
jgi:hypothetical protein